MNRSVRRSASKSSAPTKFDKALGALWNRNRGRTPISEEELARQCGVSRVYVNKVTREAMARAMAALVASGVWRNEIRALARTRDETCEIYLLAA